MEDVGASQGSTVILASIVQLGLDLDLTITAEGVETRSSRWLRHRLPPAAGLSVLAPALGRQLTSSSPRTFGRGGGAVSAASRAAPVREK